MVDNMGVRKIITNFMTQLFIQNVWNFSSEQRSGMILVLSTRTRTVIRPPRSSVNTNPFYASFLTGILVREWNKKEIGTVLGVLESTLAVQGDDLYWRLLRPTALLAAIFLVLLGQPLLGIGVYLLGFNIFAQGERLVGYPRGLKNGKYAVGKLINNTARIKKVVFPIGGFVTGLLLGTSIFNIDISSPLINPDWFLFIPLFFISVLFSLFKIPTLLTFLFNLVALVIAGFIL